MADKSILELPEITDLEGFWVLGSRQGEAEDDTYSGRYSLPDFVAAMAKLMQRERRVYMEVFTGSRNIFLVEKTNFYKVVCRNISSLNIDGVEIALEPVDGMLGVSVAEFDLTPDLYSLVSLEMQGQLTDPDCYVVLFGRISN
jgi:hypothetical protein